MAEPVSRRERARVDTVREIKDTARRVLVASGPEGLALRAIAREMGMTAPGLYRYFASREDLVEHVVADLYDELVGVLVAERDAARPATTAARLMATSRAFRGWATTHPREFGLLFGSPLAGIAPPEHAPRRAGAGPEGPAQAAAQRFGAVFAELVATLYLEQPFPVPAEEDVEPALRDQLLLWVELFPVPLPLGVLQVFLSCWIRLYGLVCMEVFGHLKFALDDAEPMFEAELRGLAELLGVPEAYRRA
jgi:AcrR family transcriptional regulator